MKEIELWAARDMDGKLFLYRDKPIKDKFVWYLSETLTCAESGEPIKVERIE